MAALLQTIPLFWQTVSVIAVMGALNVGGSLGFKAYAAGGNLLMLAIGALAWAIAAMLFVQLLKMQDLAIIGIASSVIQVCLVIAAGVFFFDESLSTRQFFAISVAVVAMTIAMIPAPQV